eukprot:gene20032-21996_t
MAFLAKDDVILGLKVLSTVSAGIYAGGISFIAYAAMPAARSLRSSCLLKVNKAVFPRCGPLPLTHAISTLSATGVYFASGDKDECGWLGGALAMGSLIPYTFLLIFPVNKRVMDGEVADDDAPALFQTWSNYHALRTAVAGGVFIFFAYKLAKK